MSRRTFCVEIEKKVTYRRKVWVEVEETSERLKDTRNPDWKDALAWDAEDAAVRKAKTHTLAGWEPHEQATYGVVKTVETAPGGNVDVLA